MLLAVLGAAIEQTILTTLIGEWLFDQQALFYSFMFVAAGCEVAAAIIGVAIVDCVGRRCMLLMSSVIGIACWTALAVLAAVGLDDLGYSKLPSAAASVALLCLIMFAHYLGPFMMLTIIATELHQLVVRTTAAAVVLMVSFSTRVIVLNTVAHVLCEIQWRLFVLMAAAYFGVALMALLLLPEAKQVHLERVGSIWQQHWLWQRWLAGAPAGNDAALQRTAAALDVEDTEQDDAAWRMGIGS